MAKKQYGTRIVIEGLDRLVKLDERVREDLEKAEIKALEMIGPIMLKEVKSRIPAHWLLNRSALTKKTFKGKRKNVRISFKKINVPKKLRTAQQLGRWQDASGKWQKKRSIQEKNSPGRYWVFHDVGTPKNKEKGYSPTKAKRFLKRSKKKVEPVAIKIFEREVNSALAKYR